ncbi:DNA-binding protein [Rhizobium ruizarguesonis]
MFAIDRACGLLFHNDRVYAPATREWQTALLPETADPADPVQALAWVQHESGHPMKAPVGIIGPNEASEEQVAAAVTAGAIVGRMGLAVLCGGRQGVMQGASRGAASVGGLVIGLLPHGDPGQANPFVTVVIASGIGEARNAIIAQAASCLIVIGDSHGTLSEVALGLRLGKHIFGMAGAANVKGVVQLADTEELPVVLAQELLKV